MFSLSIVSCTVVVPCECHKLLEWFWYTVKVTSFLHCVLRLSTRCCLPAVAFILSSLMWRLCPGNGVCQKPYQQQLSTFLSNLGLSSTCYCVCIKLFECFQHLASVTQWWFHVSVRVAGMVSVHCESNWLSTLCAEMASARCCLPTTVTSVCPPKCVHVHVRLF